MAEENPTEEDQKTEDPTERRLEKAFEEGKIAYSRELVHWSVLASSAALFLWLIPYASRAFLSMTASIFENCGDPLFSNVHSSQTPLLIIHEVIRIVALLFVIVVAIIAVGSGQTKGNFTLSQLAPKLERISPFAGAKRIFGSKALIEFLKNLTKMIIVAAVMFYSVKAYKDDFITWSTISLSDGLVILREIFEHLFIAALSILAVIAGLDYAYQCFSHWKSLKMSKQEIKDEHKEQEGNPQIKSKLKELRMARVRSSMGKKVKDATVVVTNPTHYAVAIHWDEENMDAPKVVAKGADFLAHTIRDIAKTNHVPIVENPPLARSLYDKVKIDQEIEPEHYRAVAEVIKFVTDLAKKRF